MSLSSYKIVPSDYTDKDIASLDDEPELSATELKSRFDALVKEVVATKLNAIIDLLAGNLGANEIGKTVTDMAGTNVGALIAELNTSKASTVAPSFTGNATAVTQLAADSSAKIATTEFVHDVANALVVEAGAADMTKAVYDTANKAQDIFTYSETAGRTTYTASLTVAGWTSSNGVYTQTVTVTGLAASGYVYICAPSETSHDAYVNSGVWLKDIAAANSATFVCKTLPTEAISAVILGVKVS